MADDEKSPFEPRKILVRDLAPNTTEDDLNHYFTQFIDVTELADVPESIIPHNSVTGSPHSFGFVVFRYPAALRIPFILQLPHSILDRCVEVSRALKGEDLQTLESQRKVSTGEDNFERIGNLNERNIIVRGQSPRLGIITNDEFLRFFQGFGHVIDFGFWNDVDFGHVTFWMKRGADRVLYRRSYSLSGRRFTVNILKRIPLDHNDARNPNVSRAINIQEEAGASSGRDQANGTTRAMQRQASSSDSHARNVQIIAAAESSGTDHDIKKRRKSFKEKRDDWYHRIFDKYEKQEKKANKKLKRDEETKEEMSDQGGDQSDESEEKVGDGVEVYAGAIKSGSDEDEEDNNPAEVYSTVFDPNYMNLEYDLNDIVYGPGDLCLKASAVVTSDGQVLYWASTFPQVNLEEISELWRAFDLGGDREVHLAGERHMMVRAEPSMMRGGGVVVFRTRNTLVFGLSEDPVIPGQCIERTRKLADYMEKHGM